jgi:hypothetical protein
MVNATETKYDQFSKSDGLVHLKVDVVILVPKFNWYHGQKARQKNKRREMNDLPSGFVLLGGDVLVLVYT